MTSTPIRLWRITCDHPGCESDEITGGRHEQVEMDAVFRAGERGWHRTSGIDYDLCFVHESSEPWETA